MDQERGALDQDVVDALAAWIVMGFDPGSFGNALLLDDYALALTKAHELLRPDPDKGREDVVANMIAFTRTCVPMECRGSPEAMAAWSEMGGLSGAANPPAIDAERYRIQTGQALAQAWFWQRLPEQLRSVRPGLAALRP